MWEESSARRNGWLQPNTRAKGDAVLIDRLFTRSWVAGVTVVKR